MRLAKHLLLGTAILTVLSTGAYAADLSMPMKAAPMMAPAASSWDGPYVGASVGYGWGTATDDTFTTGSTASPITDTASMSGWLIGGQIGYNFHLSDNIVAGVEGNLDWLNETGTYDTYPAYTQTINWEGSVRGRLGVDMGQFLPYVEAGVAFANSTLEYTTTPWSESMTHVGWTVGAGAEFTLADHLSANVEYRYSDYGKQTYDSSNSVSLTDSTVRAGLNYHF